MKIVNRLFLQIVVMCLSIIILVSLANIFLTQNTLEDNYDKKNQLMNAGIADHLVHETQPFINGAVNDTALHNIMHSMMAVNPSIEVYLLNETGEILSYVAPHKKIKLKSIDIAPIKQFISSKGKDFIKGDDPRNPGVKKIFSATSVMDGETLMGYVYIVLISEEHDAIAQSLSNDYTKEIGIPFIILVILTSLVIASILAWWITRYLRTIVSSVKIFSSGNLHERIPVKKNTELNSIAIAFNNMADTILSNIEQIQSVEEVRRELVANISHDLRTPIAVSKGYIETALIKSDSSEEERTGYLETALKSTEKMERLVSDLFQLSKLEAKGFEPQKELFYITDLVSEVSDKYKLIAKERQITIKPDIYGELPQVYGDIALIERVLQNLVDNAIKFTSPGGNITIAVAKSKQNVLIEVEDTGVGIESGEIAKIFDRFHKSGNTGGGTGLGLAIVKRILLLHNSTISLQSEINIGSKFSFMLPHK